MTLGLDVSKTAQAEPALAMLYATYDQCRSQQLEIVRMPDRRDKDKERIVVVQWPSGYHQLPHPGGYEQQPYFLMKMFAAFMKGEKAAVSKLLSGR